MDYDQFWMWMEFNRLSTFLPEREDWRNAQLLSMIHNVNTTEKSHLTQPNDFMPRSMDEIVEEEIKQMEAEENLQDAREAAIHNFNQHVANLKSMGSPVKQIKV